MIEFKNKLPQMYLGLERGYGNGTYNNFELVLPSVLTTTDSKLGEFMHGLHNIIHDDRRLVFIDGRVLRCSLNWIRDHVHEMKAFKHWEYDLKSFLQFILDTQREDGCFYELIKQMDDLHWKRVNEDCYRLYEEDSQALVRIELEADIEYLVVEGAMQVYSATGDFAWLSEMLPRLEKGINYITSDRKRWSEEYGLAIRPLTIDTWDFKNDATKHDRDRIITDDEPMCIMHGDNSGLYAAMKSLAWINGKLGNAEKQEEWLARAKQVRENMFRHLWNGDFFIHLKYINHNGLDNLENVRLSLSNSYDMNRGVTDTEQSRRIIEEYLRRRETTDAFAEWFTIDPPYEKFGRYEKGDYVNGAISPFTAGELAKAAFRNGYEEYGWDILQRMRKMMERDGGVYFLYSPDDEAPQGRGPSGWGAAGLLSAIDEGLAGIVDCDCLYREIAFSPRFPVTEYTELRYLTGYEVSETFVDLRYIIKPEGMRYDLRSPAQKVNAHILLPKGKTCKKLLVDEIETSCVISTVGESKYVDVSVPGKACISFEILFD